MNKKYSKSVIEKYNYYLKNRKTKGEPYKISGFCWLLSSKKIPLEEICKREKTNRGGIYKKTREYVFNNKEHSRIKKLYQDGYCFKRISRIMGIGKHLIKKSLKISGIDIKEKKILATKEEHLEHLRTARVKWGIKKYRNFKKQGYGKNEIGEIEKNRKTIGVLPKK